MPGFDVCCHTSTSGRELIQWSYVWSHFVPQRVYLLADRDMSGCPATKTKCEIIPLLTAEDLPSDQPLVLMAPDNGRFEQGEVSLIDFVHPAEAIYLFGPDNSHVSTDTLGSRVPDHKVFIPTDTPDDMWASVAAAVTLYDRVAKSG